MIVFPCPEFERMAAALCEAVPGLATGVFRAGRFNNGELFMRVETLVHGEDCAILGSVSPPDSQLLSTLLLAHTLRKEGARRVTGAFPYLAWSRQDKDKPGHSLAAAWTGALAQASGFDRIVTIDVHSPEDERLCPIPLVSVSSASLFGAAVNRFQLGGATIIAPDAGAIPRCEAIRAAAGLAPAAIPWFEKHRTETGIEHIRFTGEVGVQAVLPDDILDTGATLVSACQRLFCAGVEDIGRGARRRLCKRRPSRPRRAFPEAGNAQLSGRGRDPARHLQCRQAGELLPTAWWRFRNPGRAGRV
jgi:ribose-phosphate pyrophosphokinase